MFLVEQNAYHALKLAHRGYVMVNGLITLVRHRPRTAGAAGDQVGLSRRRAAHDRLSIASRELLYEEGSFGVFLLVTRHPGRRRGVRWPAAPSPRPGGPGGRWSRYSFILGAAVRFIHFSLFDGTLLSAHYYLVDSRGLHGLRILRVSGRPRGPDGRAISLDQRGATAPCAGAASRPDVTFNRSSHDPEKWLRVFG